MKKIIHDFLNLLIIRASSLIMPLVIFPYLLSVIGKEKFGEILFVQSIIVFFSTVVVFGTNISGLKVATLKKNINETLFLVLILRSLILLLIIFISAVVIYFISIEIKLLWIILSSHLLFELFNCQWYFQLKNKVHVLSFVNFGIRFSVVILLFAFTSDGNVINISSIITLVPIFIPLISLYLVGAHRVRMPNRPFRKVYLLFLRSKKIFLSSIIIAVKDRFNTLFLGVFFGPASVVAYELGIKLLNIITIPSSMLTTVLLPTAMKKKSLIVSMKYIVIISALSLVIMFISLVIFHHFGQGYFSLEDKDVSSVTILLFCSIPLTISNAIGMLVFNAFGYEKSYLNSVIFTTAYYCFIIILCCFFFSSFSVGLFIKLIASVYIFEMLARLAMSGFIFNNGIKK